MNNTIQDWKDKLRKLQKFDMQNGDIDFFIVKKDYTLKRVDIADNLKDRFRKNILNKISNLEEVVEWSAITRDLLDSECIGRKIGDADFKNIREQLTGDIDKIENENEILNSLLYLVQISKEEDIIYYSRNIAREWTLNKAGGFPRIIWEKGCLREIAKTPTFKIDDEIDFIAFTDILFILNKKAFEMAFKIKEEMIENKNQAIAEITKLNFIKNILDLDSLIGEKSLYLRKISVAKHKGIYNNSDHLEELIQEIKNNKEWDITIDESNKIIASQNNIRAILTLLENKRLFSYITKDYQDADSTSPV